MRIIARLNIGGPAIHTVLLTEQLGQRGFPGLLVTGVVDPGEGDLTPWAREQGVEPVVLEQFARSPGPLAAVRTLAALCRILFRIRPAVIHTHTATAGLLGRLAGLVYNVAARITGHPRARMIHTFHGHVFHGYFPAWKSALLVLLERGFARVTDCVVTVSPRIKAELVSRYRICADEKCVVVPLGFDFGWTERLAQARGRLRRATGIPPESVTVGIVGRLTGIKNHKLFLRAAGECATPEVRFVVVGDGERRRELETFAASLGLDGRVVFTGWQRDLAEVYGDLDIVCLTSNNEGTPVALIEAMVAGRAVVATRIGGVSDLMVGPGTPSAAGFEIFSNGILVPPNRVEILTAALRYLIAAPEIRWSMGHAGQAFARERFSIDRLASDMATLYGRLIGFAPDRSTSLERTSLTS